MKSLVPVTIFLISSSLMLSACRPKVQEPIPVRAPDLLEAYLADEPAAMLEAREKYNNKQLLVSGVIAAIQTIDDPNIKTVQPGDAIVLRGKDDPIISNGVECYLAPSSKNKETLSRLSRGQEIVVEGYNKDFELGHIILKPCRIKSY